MESSPKAKLYIYLLIWDISSMVNTHLHPITPKLSNKLFIPALYIFALIYGTSSPHHSPISNKLFIPAKHGYGASFGRSFKVFAAYLYGDEIHKLTNTILNRNGWGCLG